MKKSVPALAALTLLSTLSTGAMAQSSLTLYGIIDLGLVKQNRADIGTAVLKNTVLAAAGPAPFTAGAGTGSPLGGIGMLNDEWNVAQATKSRIGFKGIEDLGGGTLVKFSLEHRFKPDTGALSTTTASNAFWDFATLSITSTSFGEIKLGRDYMPAFGVQYLLDPWLNQGIAEIGGNSYAWAGYIDDILRGARYDNGVYYSLKIDGFTAQVAASLKESSTTLTKNRMGFTTMYNAGPLFVGLGYDQSENSGFKSSATTIGASYDFGFIKPRVGYAQSKLATNPYGLRAVLGKAELKPSSVNIAATIPLSKGFIKVGYAQMAWDDARTATAKPETKQSKFSLGYEYALSPKRTAIYTDVTHGKTKGLSSVSGFDVGIRHMF